MPYRALTHGRVNGRQLPPADAHQNQVKAIKSQRGVANYGPIRKRLSNMRQRRKRTLSRNFLMSKNAYGNGVFSPGQGKGFPNATPLPSVGSVNRFARRAIARRAVTKRIDTDSKNCCLNGSEDESGQTSNLNQSFTIQEIIDAGLDTNVFFINWPNVTGELSAYFPLYPSAYTSNTFITTPKWGTSVFYVDYLPQTTFNKKEIYIFLSGFTNGQFNSNKFYKLVISDEVGEKFSINIKGNVLNSLTALSGNEIEITLYKENAYLAGNVNNPAGGPVYIDFFTYTAGGLNYYDLTDINQVPTYLTNLDASGFLTSDFPVIDVNTNKINISLTEL